MRIDTAGYREVNPAIGEYRIRETRHAVGSHALRRTEIINLVLGGDRLGPARGGQERPAGLLRPAEPGRVPVQGHSPARDGYPMAGQAADEERLGILGSVRAGATSIGACVRSRRPGASIRPAGASGGKQPGNDQRSRGQA